MYVTEFWQSSTETFGGRLFDAVYDREGLTTLDKDKHVEFVQQLRRLSKFNSFLMLKGYDAVDDEEKDGHCLSLSYINQLFPENYSNTCLDTTKIDRKLCLNTFFIEILQQPRN